MSTGLLRLKSTIVQQSPWQLHRFAAGIRSLAPILSVSMQLWAYIISALLIIAKLGRRAGIDSTNFVDAIYRFGRIALLIAYPICTFRRSAKNSVARRVVVASGSSDALSNAAAAVRLLRDVNLSVIEFNYGGANFGGGDEAAGVSVSYIPLNGDGAATNVYFHIKILESLLTAPSAVYLATDIPTLLPCIVASRIFGSRIAYADVNSSEEVGFAQKFLNRILFNFVDIRVPSNVLLRGGGPGDAAKTKFFENLFYEISLVETSSSALGRFRRMLLSEWQHGLWPTGENPKSRIEELSALQEIFKCPGCGTAKQSRIVSGAILKCESCSGIFPFSAFDVDLFPHDEALGARRKLWRAWFESQLNSFAQYKMHPEWNISHADRADTVAFKNFCSRYVGESSLDVGCGVFANDYLNRESRKLVGIDPYFANTSSPGMLKVRGIGERLPFADGVFDSVIFATSLDHVVDPLKVLAEVNRVLRPGGTLLVWDALLKIKPYYSSLNYLQKFLMEPSLLHRFFAYGSSLWRTFPRFTYFVLSRIQLYGSGKVLVPSRIDGAHIYRLSLEELTSALIELNFVKIAAQESPIVADEPFVSMFMAYKKS